MSTKAAHHKGSYHRRSQALLKRANADPETVCWKCNRTLEQVRLTKPKAHWCAGHLVRGQVDGDLAPECSPCSDAEGGRTRTRRRRSPRAWE